MNKTEKNKKLTRKGILKKFKKNIKGITLIALVVTIIVLLILAGVAINLSIGDNGIFKRAQDAAKKAEEAQDDEEEALAMLEAATNINGSEYKEGDITVKIPSGFTVSPKENENNLEDGLVILDSTGNEYVWIEVPKTAEVYPTAGIEITSGADGKFTTEEYTKIENDLHTYTSKYRNGTSYKDEYYSNETTGLTKTQYNDLKRTMLQSVYENGGFWIGRYEAGIMGSDKDTSLIRTSHTSITLSAVTKKNFIPYGYVNCSEAQTLASNINSGNYTSSLMFGVQWDLVLKYLETKGVSETDLNSDSSSWGNLRDATFTLNRGKYAKHRELSKWYNYTEDIENCVTGGIKKSASSSTYSILLTTGASDAASKQNIYDIVGNVCEWTLEYTNNWSYHCAYRSGSYYSTGHESPASIRTNQSTTNSNFAIGFRVTLY